MSSTRTNHCSLGRISSGAPERSAHFTVWVTGFCSVSRPASFNRPIIISRAPGFLRSGLLVFLLAIASTISSAAMPAGVSSAARSKSGSSLPYLLRMTRVSSLCFSHHSLSVSSPKVQHMTRPVPFSRSTFASATIGTSMLNSGVRAFLPSYFAASSGWYISATQAGSSSGRVVITGAGWPSMLNRMMFCELAISLSTISAWAMAV